jgi:hypothetical protein
MASYNYIQLVNDVLVRLREPEASSVSDTAYVKLIAKYVNDSKRQVEDAYNWNALSETLSATTTADVFNYVLVGSGQRFRVQRRRGAQCITTLTVRIATATHK